MRLESLVPMLGVTDIRRTIEFYRDALGFEVQSDFAHDGNLRWAMVRAGGTEVMFAQLDDHHESGRTGRHQVILYFYTDGVDVLRSRLVDAGYSPSESRVTFYRMKEFELDDPDGYRLWFAQDTDEPMNVESSG